MSNIRVGGAAARATDVLGHVYEYFLEQFALAEGRKGGEFYTPRSVVQPAGGDAGALHAGACTTRAAAPSGMFVQSLAFIRAHASGNGNGGRARARHLDLRAGVELHDVAHGADEPGYSGYRGSASSTATRFP